MNPLLAFHAIALESQLFRVSLERDGWLATRRVGSRYVALASGCATCDDAIAACAEYLAALASEPSDIGF